MAAWTAAAMCVGGGVVGMVSGVTPGGPQFMAAQSWTALVLGGVLAVVGPRLPRSALAALGPLSVVAIAASLAVRQGSGDGEMRYIWPVLWTSYFYGRKGAALIVVVVGAAHAVVIRSYPPVLANFDSWLDVMVATSVVAVVIQVLVRHDAQLLVRLERSEEQFRELADDAVDVVFRFSRVPEPHFEYLSPSYERITGTPVASVKADFGAFVAAQDDAGRAVLADMIAGNVFRTHLDLPFRRADGTLGMFDLRLVETAVGVHGIARDVTEIRALQTQLAEEATRDPLTGLANRRFLDEFLDRALRRARRSGTRLTVAFLDLDGFKSVNDTHGHDAGDAVLRATAARLEDAVREVDLVARYGGDEFVVVFEGADDHACRSLVERIHDALIAPIEIGGGVTVRCGTSIGVANTRSTAANASALIGAADRAMLDAKKHTATSPRQVVGL